MKKQKDEKRGCLFTGQPRGKKGGIPLHGGKRIYLNKGKDREVEGEFIMVSELYSPPFSYYFLFYCSENT